MQARDVFQDDLSLSAMPLFLLGIGEGICIHRPLMDSGQLI
jgi:hypothetical protein